MKKLSVLIADDDAVIRMDLRALLEDLGHTVVGEASGGYEAVRLAREAGPSVAVLDVRMPNGTGLEAAAMMGRERLCPVVLLTAYSEAHLIEEASRAGVLGYIVKPFSRQDIQPALEIATARYRELLALEGQCNALKEEMETERVVQEARRILMRRHGVHEIEAMRRMRLHSSAYGKTLREVAEAIVLTANLAL